MAHNRRRKHLVIAIVVVMCLAGVSAIFGLRGCYPKTPPVQNTFDKCATVAPSLEKRRVIAQALQRRRQTNPTAREAASVAIPVYFHVLTDGYGDEGNVSDEDVYRQIDVLNAAFAGDGPGGTGAATPFKFVLAAIDRTPNDAWFNMTFSEDPTAEEKAAKTALNKGDKSTLNIYTVKLAERPFGWARWPWDFAEGVDGVVIRYSTLPGGGTYSFNEGDTATHEVGHWLGLFHTFEGGCTDPGDSVDDTSSEAGPAVGCPVSRNTCPSAFSDPVENFMNYTNDGCMYRFTAGQSDRMDTVHLEYRS